MEVHRLDVPSLDAGLGLGVATEDPVRDLSPQTLATVRKRLDSLPHAERLLAVLEGEEERDERSLGRIFGEELPSGLVLARTSPE